jgi:hypothetical protein
MSAEVDIVAGFGVIGDLQRPLIVASVFVSS